MTATPPPWRRCRSVASFGAFLLWSSALVCFAVETAEKQPPQMQESPPAPGPVDHQLNLPITKMLAQAFLAAVREDYDVLEAAGRDGDKIIRSIMQEYKRLLGRLGVKWDKAMVDKLGVPREDLLQDPDSFQAFITACIRTATWYKATGNLLEKIFYRATRRAYSLIGALMEYTASGVAEDLAEIRLLFKEMLKQLKSAGFVTKAQGGWRMSSVKQWEADSQTPLQVKAVHPLDTIVSRWLIEDEWPAVAPKPDLLPGIFEAFFHAHGIDMELYDYINYRNGTVVYFANLSEL